MMKKSMNERLLVLCFLAMGLIPLTSAAQYELQILHASDLEGGVEAIDRAKNFAAIVDLLEDEYENTLVLSAGDNYIPGPFYNAAGDQAVFRDDGVFNSVYNQLFPAAGYDALREGGGRVDISIMNVIGFDASALGNHEFDAGPDAIQSIIEEDFRSPAGPSGDRWVGTQFPYLSANLDFSGDGSLSGLYTSDILTSGAFATGPDQSNIGDGNIPKIAPATTVERNGELIGIVGATTPLIQSISSPGDVNVVNPDDDSDDMAALAAVLQPVIDELTDLGVNKIVLVSHLQQFALEQELSGLLNDVDIIIAGGSDFVLANEGDDLLPEDADNVSGSYPFETTNGNGNPCLIVSTNGEYSYVGRLVVSFDENGVIDLSSISAESGPYVTTDEKVSEIWADAIGSPFDPGTKGSLVMDLTEAVSGVVISKDSNIFGSSAVFLDGRRSQVRTEETNLGNLTADANLWFGQQVDASTVVSIKNGGGIRAAIGEVVILEDGTYQFFPPQENPLSGKNTGEISQLDIENSLRFNNALSLLTLTAEGLLAALEHGVASWAPDATPGSFCQVGGVKFSFDPDQPAGDRIVNCGILDETGMISDVLVENGIIQGDPERTFRVITLNFLAGGGDGYPFDTFGTDRVDLNEPGETPIEVIDAGVASFADAGTEQDALAEFFANFYGTEAYNLAETPANLDGRIQNLSLRSDAIFDDPATVE
ncbi:MAG: 5'-nucleotidase C-terminal domain-containing protein, partial [Flavobacteriales bacterium]|nr:5'-nucleotidase C-terminal domain-containing protein [Flavobacteriales bacterium]